MSISIYVHLDAAFPAKAGEQIGEAGRVVPVLDIPGVTMFFQAGGDRLVFVPAGFEAVLRPIEKKEGVAA